MRRISCHQMDVGGAGFGKFSGQSRRVRAVHGHLPVIALIEPNRLPFVQVDGRKQDHAFPSSSQKARRMARPTGPLFSGWNWQPITFPFCTMAVMGMPYSAVATRLSAQPVA